MQTLYMPQMTFNQPIFQTSARPFSTDPEQPGSDNPKPAGLVTKSFLKAKDTEKQPSGAKTTQKRSTSGRRQTSTNKISASVKLEEYKWNIQQRKNKRVIIDDATLRYLEKEYNVVDGKFRNQMKKNLKAQTGDYQGLKKALGRSKSAQGLDENAYLIQKWSDPLKALDKELNEVGASSPQGKKL